MEDDALAAGDSKVLEAGQSMGSQESQGRSAYKDPTVEDQAPAGFADLADERANSAEPDCLAPFLEGGAIVVNYQEVTKFAGRKVNFLVERCLLEAVEAGRETFFIEAPGNHKMVFGSRLGDKDMPTFVQVFNFPVPFLSRLDLSYNELSDEGISLLSSSMLGSRASRLNSFSVRANSIGPAGCQALCQSLRYCRQLKRLDVSRNPLGRIGGLAVIALLQANPGILEVFLGDTEIDIDVLVALSSLLLTGSLQLKVCEIENPRIISLQEDHTVHLGRMLRMNTHICELYLGKHRMRDDGVRQLVDFLLENKVLRVLDLRCNDLGADGAKHLGKLLASDCRLLKLNLSGNRIGEKDNVQGAKAIAEALRGNSVLRHLDLNHNGLCGEALLHLAEAVEASTTLQAIQLFHSKWDQPSSYKFHSILNDAHRATPLKADFVTSEVDLRIDVCKLDGLEF